MAPADLIVVGAGPSGLIGAHTWLEINPDDEVILLEGGSDLGGVWSKSRIYPTMMTQTPVGMLEYSCYPMPILPKEETFYDLFSGSHVCNYLEDFSSHKSFAGKTIKDRIAFNSQVTSITKVANVWNIETQSGKTYSCRKLIMATGLTSLPNLPKFTKKNFTPPIIHTLNLAQQTSFLSSPSIKNIVVLGGAKSSFDSIQLLQPLSKHLTWIIRTTGQGPALLATPDAPYPLSNSHEIISTRLVSKMNPCIFEPLDNWTRFFHGNKLGIWLTNMMWSAVNAMWKSAANYDRNENMKNLKPDRPVFWSSDAIAVSNNLGLWDGVSGASILRDDIELLEGDEVILKSGKHIPCDAIVAATGWLNNFPLFSNTLSEQMGLPLLPSEADPKRIGEWEERIKKADQTVLTTFPRLATQPTYPDRAAKSTPSRLYRSLIPISSPDAEDSDPSIAFLGTVGTTQSFLVFEIQALWVAAYFSKKLTLPTKEKMVDDVALATAWRRRRYLGDGYTFIFEQLQYNSMLMRDLGLKDERKGGWREILQPYSCRDYKGILDEWRALCIAKGDAGSE